MSAVPQSWCWAKAKTQDAFRFHEVLPTPSTITGGGRMYVSSEFTVIVRNLEPLSAAVPPMKHLSIRRNDRAGRPSWPDTQRIKNALVGPECEGVEIYPAESRLVDVADQYHLWVVADPAFRFGFGFQERMTKE